MLIGMRSQLSAMANNGMRASSSSKIPLSNIIAWWSFDESDDSTRLDNSPNGLSVTPSGSQTHGAGKIENCAILNGGYFTRSGDGLPDITGDFSIAAWINITSQAGLLARGIVGKNNGITNQYLLYQRISSTKLALNVGTLLQLNSDTSLNTDQWYFVVAIWNSATNEAKLYINNALDSSDTTELTISTVSTNFNIGSYNSSALNVFDGKIDEMALFNVVLSADQINMLYNSTFGVSFGEAIA